MVEEASCAFFGGVEHRAKKAVLRQNGEHAEVRGAIGKKNADQFVLMGMRAKRPHTILSRSLRPNSNLDVIGSRSGRRSNSVDDLARRAVCCARGGAHRLSSGD